jgi:predicted RNA-binding Zn-ribbon protein involved in translation (DUF1610 family)
MKKLVRCSSCGYAFVQRLPDVSRSKADQLKAAGEDRAVRFQCPNCGKEIQLRQWDLADLPDAR